MVALSLIAVAAAHALPTTFTFNYSNINAKQVSLAGDVDGWDSPAQMRKTDGGWTLAYHIPEDSRFEYKLIVDGKWTNDPENPKVVDNTLGGENSVFEGPAYRAKFDAHLPQHPLTRTELVVRGRKITIFAPQVSAGLPIILYGDGPNYEKYGTFRTRSKTWLKLEKCSRLLLA